MYFLMLALAIPDARGHSSSSHSSSHTAMAHHKSLKAPSLKLPTLHLHVKSLKGSKKLKNHVITIHNGTKTTKHVVN